MLRLCKGRNTAPKREAIFTFWIPFNLQLTNTILMSLMRKPISAAILALAAAHCAIPAYSTQLFVVTGADSWTKHQDGVARFSAEDPSDYTLIYDDINACNTGNWPDWYMKQTSLYYYAGDNKIMGYHPRRVSQGFSYYFENISWATYAYDGETFTQSSAQHGIIPGGPGTNESAFPNMLAYNPVSGKVYGSNVEKDIDTQMWSTVIREVDPETGVRGEEAARLVNTLINSITTDARGVTYVTQSNGNLCTLNLVSGEITVLGDIGIYNGETAWSCFDYSSGKLYMVWGTNLYEVDVENVSAKKLASIPVPENTKIRGLFCFGKADVGPVAAPGAPSGLEATFDAPGSLTAKISVAAPLYCFDGTTPLTGKVGIRLFVNGGTEPAACIENLTAGQTSSTDITFAAAGSHTLTAVAFNEIGESAPATLITWAGFDVPAAPGNPLLSIAEDGAFTASWEAPTEGEHGCAIDGNTLTYKVTLHPEGRVFDNITGTSLAGNVGSDDFNSYHISVAATAGGLESSPAVSPKVWHGASAEPAWTDDFSDAATYGKFVVVDANDDGTTWDFKSYLDIPCVQVNGFRSPSAMDEWLITPPIRIRKDATYTLSFQAFAGMTDEVPGKLEVHAGTLPQTGSMARISADSDETVAVHPGNGMRKITYTAQSDGDIYFAFRALSPAGSTICLQNVAVEASVLPAAPAAATGIAATPGEEGLLKATVGFTAPTADNTGKPLTGISEVRLMLDGGLKTMARLTDVAPGEQRSMTIDVPAIGKHTFTVVCYNGAGTGEAAVTEAWIGEDMAGKVQNLEIQETDDSYMVTWDTPSESLHGMWVDYGNLKYDVMLWYTGLEEPITYAYDLEERSCEVFYDDILRRIPAFTGQINVEIYVFPVSAAGYGEAAGAVTVYGDPYPIPFAESFAGGTVSTSPWTTIEAGYDYQNAWAGFHEESAVNPDKNMTSADGDGGMAAFYQNRIPQYSERLISPRLNKPQGQRCELSFYVYHLPDAEDGNTLQAEANVGITDFLPVGEAVVLNQGKGWTLHTISLDEVPDGDFRIAFKATGTAGTPIYIDGIRVEKSSGIADAHEDGIAIKTLKGAVAITAEEAGYTVHASNGTAVATGTVRGTVNVPLAPGIYIVRAGGTTRKCVVN